MIRSPFQPVCIHCLRMLLVCAFASPASPALLFETTSLMLDTLIQGDTARISYPFVNTTHGSIFLEEIRTDCNCTAVIGDKKAYAPGEHGTIDIEFVSSGFRGTCTKRMVVVSRALEDSTQSALLADTLSFTVFIKCEVQFRPPSITAMHRQRSEALFLKGELINISDTIIRLVSLTTDTAAGLDVLTKQLPLELGRDECLPFSVFLPANAIADSTKQLCTRLIARTQNTKYAEHYCEIRIFLD